MRVRREAAHLPVLGAYPTPGASIEVKDGKLTATCSCGANFGVPYPWCSGVSAVRIRGQGCGDAMSHMTVTVNGAQTIVDMAGATTAEQANQRLADAGLGGSVRVLMSEEIDAISREQEARIAVWRQQQEELRRWHEALASKLRFSEASRSVELTRQEAEALLNGLEADYSDE